MKGFVHGEPVAVVDLLLVCSSSLCFKTETTQTEASKRSLAVSSLNEKGTSCDFEVFGATFDATNGFTVRKGLSNFETVISSAEQREIPFTMRKN